MLIKVYVKINNNIIIDISSSTFIEDATGYIVIDEGQGDKYSHAQNLYLEKGLMDMQGKHNYKLIDGEVVELTAEEKDNLFPTPAQEPTETEILKQELDNANKTIERQASRIKQVETDAVAFQDFILETLGGN